jgi:stage IV sporulation protein B
MKMMFLSKIKNIIIASLLSLLIIPVSLLAYSSHLIPGGENIGIQINSKGIIIVGLYKVDDRYPGKDAGLRVGDKILSINNTPVSSIADMVAEIGKIKNNSSLLIKYQRNENIYQTTLELVGDDEYSFKTGLYVKDSINGIGTLTFIDPKTKIFGALGHEIIERTTNQRFEVRTGKIFKSEVTNIEKSTRGHPGEKNAKFFTNEIYGLIYKNTPVGVFGIYQKELPNKDLIEIAEPDEVKLGPATIYTVLMNNKVEAFDINIIKLNKQPSQKQKNILFEVIDDQLLNKTGGIVQGMSGSPIIQNDKLIGAVTHVIVDNSERGYGIFIKWMLEEATN